MGCVGGAITGQSGRDLLESLGNVHAADDSFEEGEGGLWLVVWDLVTGVVDSSEREVAALTSLAILDSAIGEWLVPGRIEFGLVRVIDLQTDGLSAKPVANIV